MKTLLCILLALACTLPAAASADTTSTGQHLASALKKHLNDDYTFEGLRTRALSVVCQTRGGRHYACMAVIGSGRRRARIFYRNAIVNPATGEWNSGTGQTLAW